MIAGRSAVCAASALVCTLMCASSAWGVYSRDINQPDDFSHGQHQRVSFSYELGGLTLNRALVCTPFVWIPCADTNTVSKFDARTGQELARYRMGPEGEDWMPVAVIADAEGNAYVACGCYESTGKIVCIAGSGSDGLAISRTSGDFDGNLRITSTEVLPWGQDARVGRVIEVGSEGAAPSALAFDGGGCLWVGLWGERTAVKVDLGSRAVVTSVPLVGRPTHMLADDRGSLWVLSRDSRTLCQVNTVTGTLSEYYELGERVPTGMCMDRSGQLWIPDARSGLIGFQTVSEIWSKHADDIGVGFAGVAIDRDGDIWAACPARNEVWRFSGEDGDFLSSVAVGGGPSSISVDEDGYVWVLNQSSGTATRVDTRYDKPVLTAQTAGSPFSSTPFVSCVTKRGMSPEGSWGTVFDSRISGAGWGMISWQSTEAGGRIRVEARTAETPDALQNAGFFVVSNGERFAAPNGRYLEVKVVFLSSYGVSPVLHALRVEGTNLAPDVSKAAPSISRLTSGDGAMEPVSITGVTDPEGDPVTVTITRVVQDEPVAGLWDDDQSPDAAGVGTPCVMLRAECDPGTEENPGNGRVYTVTFKAEDVHGASTVGRVKVTVPPGVLPCDKAVEDETKYDSTKHAASLASETSE